MNKIDLYNDTYGFGVDHAEDTLKYISGSTSHKWYYNSSSGQNGTLGMTLESGNLTVAGNLTIEGSTTTLNTTTLTVEDHHIELGVGATDDAAVDGGGIILKGATDKSITWNNDNSEWLSNKDFTVSGTVQNTETLIKKITNPVLQLEQETYYYTGEATTSGDVGTIRFQNKDTDKRATIVGHVFNTKHMPSILFKTGATWGNLDTRMTIREDGNVGIGTNNPGAKLNLHTTASGGGTGDNTVLLISDSSGGHCNGVVMGGGGAEYWGILQDERRDTGQKGDLQIVMGSKNDLIGNSINTKDSNVTEIMTLKNDGNVGIGIMIQIQKLN